MHRNTQYSDPRVNQAETNARIEALKKKNFRPGELVVIGGGISGEFVRSDLKNGDAYVRINGREQKANPKSLERSGKTR